MKYKPNYKYKCRTGYAPATLKSMHNKKLLRKGKTLCKHITFGDQSGFIKERDFSTKAPSFSLAGFKDENVFNSILPSGARSSNKFIARVINDIEHLTNNMSNVEKQGVIEECVYNGFITKLNDDSIDKKLDKFLVKGKLKSYILSCVITISNLINSLLLSYKTKDDV